MEIEYICKEGVVKDINGNKRSINDKRFREDPLGLGNEANEPDQVELI